METFYFKGSDLKDNTDVMVELGSMMPFSKVGRQQFILDLARFGLLEDRKKVLKMLEFATEEDVWDEDILDEAAAKTENEELKAGSQPIAMHWDNHQIHRRIHRNFIKSPEFKEQPEHIKQLFLKHDQGHEEHEEAEIMRQQALLAQMQQKAAGAGGARPPGT